jgi:tRNA(Ile2) C34 agmatinyltransferase TiaS
VSGALAIAPRVAEPAAGGGLTLEQHLSELLDRARAHEEALCPVCRGGMEPADEGARCRDCGTSLA